MGYCSARAPTSGPDFRSSHAFRFRSVSAGKAAPEDRSGSSLGFRPRGQGAENTLPGICRLLEPLSSSLGPVALGHGTGKIETEGVRHLVGNKGLRAQGNSQLELSR
ncbi:hypothetical protein chiPu_0028409 [Chiloscyllium punctatum]|uniref:Uncharacterized protein n=1 Tax=Chiloscyllium punctatum TaxID=137246 RepID=A0A401TPR1_CHIPU|nr:hypothetical protein [Chiloscyllium punctatum]